MPLVKLTALLLSIAASAGDPSRAPQSEFIELYSVTCLANAFTPDKLRETLGTPLTPELSKEQAEPFLAGRRGTAWRVTFGKGQYAVALTDPGICAVYARQAPIDLVTSDFDAFVSHAPSGMHASQLSADKAGPNSADLTSTAYIWEMPDKAPAILFTLTTSRSATDPQIQAMASVMVGRPEP